MSAPTLKEPTDPNPGTSAAWGAPDAVQCAQLIKGTYPGQAIPEAAIKNTAMTLGTGAQVITGSKIFNNTILQVNNPVTTFKYKVNSSAILSDINITLPLLVADDVFVFANFVQTLTNKTIDGGSNSLANIASSSIVTRLTSKDLADSTTISNVSATSKAIAFSLSGMTASVILTISSSQSTSQTLTIPNITGADTLMTLALAQTILAAKTFTTGLLKVADIADANGLKSIAITATASAVDYLTVVNGATANPATVQINATGSDSNVHVLHNPKGTGKTRFGDGADNTKIVDLSISGATAGKIATLTFAHTNDITYTFPDASITLGPTVLGKQDLFIPAVAFWVTTTSGATAVAKTETSTNKLNYQGISFVNGATNRAECLWMPPRNWDGGTIKVSFTWLCTNSSTNSAVMFASAVAIPSGTAIDQAQGTQQSVTTANTGTSQVVKTALTPAITVAGTPAGGAYVQIRIERESGGSDNLAQPILLLGINIEYTINAAVAA